MEEALVDVAAEAIRRDARRYGLVFVQVGAAHAPWRDTLVAVGDQHVSVAEAIAADPCEPGLVVIDNLEEIASGPESDMSRLRAVVLERIDGDCKFVLLSRYPKSRFDRVPGSSLLLDARTTVLPLGAFGSARDDSSGVWPACAQRDQSVEIVSREIFDELGLDIVASLDHALYESFLPRDEMIELLSEREADALYGAGLLRRMDGHYAWAIPNRYAEVRNALAQLLATTVSPQDELPIIFAELWSLERTLRKHLRSGLARTVGNNWRSQCLHGDLGERVLGRAREDVYAGAKSLRELRDPLEWLSLGELLEVRESSGVGGLGVEEVVWDKFKREVAPVRNRVSHMRLLRSGDLDVVRQWRAILGRKLT